MCIYEALKEIKPISGRGDGRGAFHKIHKEIHKDFINSLAHANIACGYKTMLQGYQGLFLHRIILFIAYFSETVLVIDFGETPMYLRP